jgi:hypothetical protein
MVFALTIVVAAKKPTLQHRSTLDTIGVKKFSRRSIALNLVSNYCTGFTIVVKEKCR